MTASSPRRHLLHGAFKKAMDDPKHLELLAQPSQDLWHQSPEAYAQWVRVTYVKEKRFIEKLGLAAK
jgi:tripartite-type tricarboxylate transporter receptor subunit TctC